MRLRIPLLLAFMILFQPILAAENKGRFFGAKDTEIPAWFKDSFLDLKEDVQEATAGNKRLMLFFMQDGCPYCNALVERNLSQQDIAQKARANFDIIALNMWGDRELTYVDGTKYTEKTFAEAMKIQFTPTLIFFNEQGEIILRLNGYRSPQRFSVDLDYIAGKKETQISYRDYVKANLPEKKSSHTLHAEPFYSAAPYDLTKQSRPLAVFFEQKDCPNCDYLHTRVLTDPKLREVIGQFESIQLDMWSNTPLVTPAGKQTTAREWARSLDIKYAPSIVLFNTQGQEVIRTEAFFKVFHNIGVFNYVLTEAYREQPSFQRYLSEYADHLREQGVDVDIWRVADEEPGPR